MAEAHQACQLTSEWIKNLREAVGVNDRETLCSLPERRALPLRVDTRNLFASSGKGRGAEQTLAYSTAQRDGRGSGGSCSDPRGTRICPHIALLARTLLCTTGTI